MADFLGNQLQNLLNIKPIDLGQTAGIAAASYQSGLQRKDQKDKIAREQAAKAEQNQTKNAAAQALAVYNLPKEQRGQAIQGLFAQAEQNKDQQLMQGLAQLNEMGPSDTGSGTNKDCVYGWLWRIWR